MAAKKSSDNNKKSKAEKLPKASAVAEKSAAKAPQKAEKKAAAKKAEKQEAAKQEAAKQEAAKATEKKPVAAPKAAEPKKAAPPKPVYTPEQVYRMIEEEAYYIAERSGFQRSSQDCWVQAEASIQLRVG